MNIEHAAVYFRLEYYARLNIEDWLLNSYRNTTLITESLSNSSRQQSKSGNEH